MRRQIGNRLAQPTVPSNCQVGTLGPERPLLYTGRVEKTGRLSLPHERPLWLSDSAVYFVTIYTLQRGGNMLAKAEVARPLIDSFVWRHFFAHRLRSGESRSEKSDNILNNPIRAGLVETVGEWPFRWAPGEKKSDG